MFISRILFSFEGERNFDIYYDIYECRGYLLYELIYK